MTPFLKEVAEDLVAKFGQNLQVLFSKHSYLSGIKFKVIFCHFFRISTSKFGELFERIDKPGIAIWRAMARNRSLEHTRTTYNDRVAEEHKRGKSNDCNWNFFHTKCGMSNRIPVFFSALGKNFWSLLGPIFQKWRPNFLSNDHFIFCPITGIKWVRKKQGVFVKVSKNRDFS